jgi:hypothetical protein
MPLYSLVDWFDVNQSPNPYKNLVNTDTPLKT